ncbi:MAG: hypothetical protein R2853_19225 [Thermomicrobiales bacterium]
MADSKNVTRGLTAEPATGGPSLPRAARLTALAGAIHAGLFLISFWPVTRTPGAKSSDAELAAFYASANDRRPILIGLYLIPFAGIAFLWFADALREWTRGFRRRESALLANMQVFTGILYVGIFFIIAASYAVTAVTVELASGPIDPIMARLFPEFGRTLFFFFALRMAAVFAFTTSNIHMAAGILPKWLGQIGIAVGVVLLLTPTFNDGLSLVFPVWVLAFCGAVARAANHHQDETT